MWRTLLLAVLAALLASKAHAAAIGAWEVCRGPGPAVTDCRPLQGVIDPQDRELWLRAGIGQLSPRDQLPTLHLVGAMSTEAWFNGVRVGANGQPGPTPAAERPGRYQAEMPLPAALWRPEGNVLVLRMSAFHVGTRFANPVGGMWVGPNIAQMRPVIVAVTFAAAGALLAAAFGFGAVHAMRRTGSSLLLAAMSGVAALQAVVENIRQLVRYDYPLHAWRVGAIWLLAVTFAVLLVAYAGARFTPRWRKLLLGAALVLVPASFLSPGFDEKTGWALVIGVSLAGVAASLGVRARLSGARPVLAYLAAFMAVVVASPEWLLDLSFFVLAASLILPLLVAEVVRLGHDDHHREAALTRAAGRPDRLTVTNARGVELTPLNGIVAIVGADDYAELRLSGGRSLLHSARLERLEAQLPAGFLRIHRSVIANLVHAERLERDGARWRLHMSEGAALPVSRSRLTALREALDPPPILMRATA